MGNIALNFFVSAERSANTGQGFDELLKGQQVDSLYQYFLSRDAGQGGHDDWIDILESGKSLAQAALHFMVSPGIQIKYLQQNQWEFLL